MCQQPHTRAREQAAPGAPQRYILRLKEAQPLSLAEDLCGKLRGSIGGACDAAFFKARAARLALPRLVAVRWLVSAQQQLTRWRPLLLPPLLPKPRSSSRPRRPRCSGVSCR